MEIGSFYPIFATHDLDEAVNAYCDALGFSVVHSYRAPGRYALCVLENEKGVRIDLMETGKDIPEGLYALRVNTDDMHSAAEFFEGQGYEEEAESSYTSSTDALFLKNAQGQRIALMHHN